MITKAICDMFFNLVEGLVSVLPIMPIVQIFQQFMFELDPFFQLMAVVNHWVPVGTFFYCLGVVVSFYWLRFISSTVNWTIRKIPTIE